MLTSTMPADVPIERMQRLTDLCKKHRVDESKFRKPLTALAHEEMQGVIIREHPELGLCMLRDSAWGVVRHRKEYLWGTKRRFPHPGGVDIEERKLITRMPNSDIWLPVAYTETVINGESCWDAFFRAKREELKFRAPARKRFVGLPWMRPIEIHRSNTYPGLWSMTSGMTCIYEASEKERGLGDRIRARDPYGVIDESEWITETQFREELPDLLRTRELL